MKHIYNILFLMVFSISAHAANVELNFSNGFVATFDNQVTGTYDEGGREFGGSSATIDNTENNLIDYQYNYSTTYTDSYSDYIDSFYISEDYGTVLTEPGTTEYNESDYVNANILSHYSEFSNIINEDIGDILTYFVDNDSLFSYITYNVINGVVNDDIVDNNITLISWNYQGTTSNVPTPPNVSAVPVPGAVWLMGSGLLGLLGFRKKR